MFGASAESKCQRARFSRIFSFYLQNDIMLMWGGRLQILKHLLNENISLKGLNLQMSVTTERETLLTEAWFESIGTFEASQAENKTWAENLHHTETDSHRAGSETWAGFFSRFQTVSRGRLREDEGRRSSKTVRVHQSGSHRGSGTGKVFNNFLWGFKYVCMSQTENK